MKTVEINGVRFNLAPNTKSLNEGLVTNAVQMGEHILAEGAVGRIVNSELGGLSAVIGLIRKVIKLFSTKDNPSTISRMLRYIVAIGPISFIFLYLLTSKFVQGIGGWLITKIVDILRSIPPVVKVAIKILLAFTKKISGTFVGTMVIIVLLPIIAFINILIGLLTKSDEYISRTFSMNDIKMYNRRLFNIYRKIGNALVEAVPVIKPFIDFLGKIFKGLFNFAAQGSSRVTEFLNRAKEKESAKTESFNPISIIGGLLSGFLFGILKKIKVLGLIGLIITLGMKFSSRFKSVIMRIPVINKIIPFMLSAGSVIAAKLKLNKIAKILQSKHNELKELSKTVGVINAVAK